MNYSLEANEYEDDRTPTKKIVSCDINSWMETCAKQPKIAQKRPARYLARPKYMQSPTSRQNITNFRDFRNSLIKQALQKYSRQTPLTADSNGQLTISINHQKSTKSPHLPLVDKTNLRSIKAIEVSQFCESLTQQVKSDQTEGKKMKTSQLRLPSLPKGIDRYLNSSPFADSTIIQSKITQNQYCASKYLIRKIGSLSKN